MKNILIITMTLNTGGAEKSLINFLKNINYKEYNVDLLILKKEGKLIKDVPNKVNILNNSYNLNCLYGKEKNIYLNMVRYITTILLKIYARDDYYAKQLRWNYIYNKHIEKLEKEYDIALAYIEGEPTYFLKDKVNARRKIAWMHTDYDYIAPKRKSKMIDKSVYSNIDKVVTISSICKETLKNRLEISENKIEILSNIIQKEYIEKMAKAFEPIEFGKEKEQKNIVSIGRLVHPKGFDIAIRAAKILRKNGFNFKWYIIGEGDKKRKLQRLIKKYRLEDRMVLLGNKENPYPYILKSDLVVQTSRFEGKSIVLDEAKILSKPSVVTNYKTVRDQIIDNKDGLIAEIDNPLDVANKITYILTNDNIYQNITKYLKEQSNKKENKESKILNILEIK